jgi:anaerobic ribonucleoside-triphosphate reductase activating protein
VLRVSTIVDDTEAEGPGHRFAVWVQGCSIRCPGCCNPEMFDARTGTEMSIDDLEARLARATGVDDRGLAPGGSGAEGRRGAIEGVTFLGGEPFEQAEGLGELARRAKRRGLTVMVFSGYTLDALRARDGAAQLLDHVDLLVDGPYDRARPEPVPPVGRRWIGSQNQVMHYLTSAYADTDPRMREANTIEIRISKQGLLINGWPSAQALVRRER